MTRITPRYRLVKLRRTNRRRYWLKLRPMSIMSISNLQANHRLSLQLAEQRHILLLSRYISPYVF